MGENAIILNGVKHTLRPDKDIKREASEPCYIECSLGEYCQTYDTGICGYVFGSAAVHHHFTKQQ